jgi:polysaccharide biosynthesis/export protein ExoF
MTFAWPNPRTDTRGAFNQRGRFFAGLVAILLAIGAQSPAWSAPADGYRLSVGDVVSFDFVDDTLPAEELTISSDGELSVPLIGGFKVAGLTVPEALEAVRAVFIERKIFVEPQVSLSVVSFRPIFVLGDVKAPGSFPYQPLLTVEQAVALAGGQSAGGATGEDRVVTSARLRGNLDETEVEIAREAVGVARLMAQLAGRTEISLGDMPPKARDLTSAQLVEALLVNERQILVAEHRSFEARRDQLSAAVDEVKGALANLEQLAQKQKQVIVSAHSEHDRAKDLNKRGLKTLTDLSNVERDATTQEAHLLGIYNQMSTTRRELAELQRQLLDLTDSRTRTALTALQAHTAEIERLLVNRRSTEEQILLLSSLASEEARETEGLQFAYQIRRRVDGRVQTRSATLDDAVLSADTIIVYIDHPGRDANSSLSNTALQLVP